MRQTYVDMSQLNERFHNSLPLTGLGGNALSGGIFSGTSTLGIGALGQEGGDCLWRKPDSRVKPIQAAINERLAVLGMNAIGVDGVLGKATCGAAAWLGQHDPEGPDLPGTCSLASCQEYQAPTKKGTGPGPGPGPGPKQPPPDTDELDEAIDKSRRGVKRAAWIGYGLVGVAVLAIGAGAYALSRKKRGGRRRR